MADAIGSGPKVQLQGKSRRGGREEGSGGIAVDCIRTSPQWSLEMQLVRTGKSFASVPIMAPIDVFPGRSGTTQRDPPIHDADHAKHSSVAVIVVHGAHELFLAYHRHIDLPARSA